MLASFPSNPYIPWSSIQDLYEPFAFDVVKLNFASHVGQYHGMPEFASASYVLFFLSPSSHVLFRLLGEGGEIHVRSCGQAHIQGTP